MSDATPFDGEVLLIATTKSSVGPRVGPLVQRVQDYLASRLADYRRRYEVVHDRDERVAFLAEAGHWDRIGDRLGLDELEIAAVRRAHEEQLRWIGRAEDRESEFELALEIRDPVLVSAKT
jgi:hypothetical protein